jgi:uncharacterized membrane protein YphA (DoxX/SURF4 family)
MAAVLALCRIVTGGLFLYAASTKLPDMATFAGEVANYRMLPGSVVAFVAALVVGVEIVAGAALVIGVFARPAAIAISGLLVVFIAGLSQALLRGIDLKCGCFGGEDVATWWTVVRDVGMLLPALAVSIWGGGRLLPSREERESPKPAEAP